MQFNHTLDAPSPLLKYTGAWSPVKKTNGTNVSLFRNSTAVQTMTTGASVQFVFNGTGTW